MRLLKPFFLLFLLTASFTLRAQNIREADIKFMKGQQPAFMADYEYPKAVTEEALKERMTRAGLGKNKTEKGFMVWKGVSWPEVSPDKVDVYAMVDGKGDKSTVTLLVSKGYDNFIGTKNDPEKAGKILVILNGFTADTRAYKSKVDIAAAEDAVRIAEAEYNKQVREGNELEEDRKKIEKKIADKRDDVGKRQKQLDEARSRLEALRNEGR